MITQTPNPARPKIGVAFGGGGARGFAHVGVVHALEEAGIKADVITGTSIGSVVGAAWAAGRIHELAELACNITLKDLPFLLSPAWSLSGMFSGRSVFERMEEIIGPRQIEDLPIPFAAIASDIRNGRPVIFRQGPVIEAIRASTAIPGIFTPVCADKRVLVDGALFHPVPVSLCRELGAELVIAVDLFGGTAADSNWPGGESQESQLWGLKRLTKGTPSIIEVLARSLEISQAHLTALELKSEATVIILQPNAKGISVLDFHRGAPLIEEGYRVAKAAIESNGKLLNS